MTTGLVAILAFLLCFAATLADAVEPIRVSLGEGLRIVEVGATDGVSILDAASRRLLLGLTGGGTVRVGPAFGGLEVASRRLNIAAVRLEGRRGVLRIAGRDYAGALEVWRNGDGLLLIDELPLEEYVASAVRGETPERWPAEALRAMAVVARSYAVFLQGRMAGKPFHVVAGSQDQNFAGRVPDESPTRAAARATAGQVLMWQGRTFPTFYHSDSGGFTEAARAVFSGEGIPPLEGVRDEFSVDSPHYQWVTTLPLSLVGDRLRGAGFDVGRVRRLTVLERSPSLRVARIAVEHSGGVVTVKGTDFRRIMGYDAVKSTLFVSVVSDGTVRFEGRGWGHGVGLSQFGAKGMAERGYPYPQILAHYYPGTVLATLK